jgi:CRP/FNR family transcriptional regulator
VREFDISDSGQKITLNIFKPHAFFPMSWAINETPNKYFFEALDNCHVKIAPPNEVVNFLKSNPDVMYDLLARIYKGTDGMLGRQSKLMSGSASARLGYELMIYCRRFHNTNSSGQYSVKVKESELASFTGMARETVSRQLRKMDKDGMIRLEDGQIIIEDIKKFEDNLV